MANMTLSVPEELHERMRQHTDIKWSDVARQAFEDKLKKKELLDWMDEKLKDSTLTEKDVDEIGHAIKAGIRNRLDSLRTRIDSSQLSSRTALPEKSSSQVHSSSSHQKQRAKRSKPIRST